MDTHARLWSPDDGQSTDAEDAWLSTSTAASILGVSPETIRRAIGRGALAAIKRGGAHRIAPDDLEYFRARPGLDGEPALHHLSARPRLMPLPEHRPENGFSLPHAVAPLVGRGFEVATICSSLRHGKIRLMTLIGPGGVGKTRLALRVAESVAGDFANGVCFVSLAAVRDPDRVPAALAMALGLGAARNELLPIQIKHFLRDREVLLVLDNLEHVLSSGSLFAELLAACPHLTVLATSREVLRLSGEVVFDVQPLSLPAHGSRAVESEAVQLFISRGQAVRASFMLMPDNQEAVAEICRRLDGLPLAIELAAARIAYLSPQALLARLERRLPLLTGGARDLPERQLTMQRAISWSYDLLSPEEQLFFRRLAVFVGGFTLEAAEAVANCGREIAGPTATMAEATAALLEKIGSLTCKSLLRLESSQPATAREPVLRYTMLETIREFGLEQLAASGEEAAVRAAHAAFFLTFAERSAPLLMRSWTALPGIECEYPNVQAALSWFNARNQGAELLRLAVALCYFWESSGHWTEGIFWLERGVAMRPSPSSESAEALASIGMMLGRRGDHFHAEQRSHEALDLARQFGDPVQTSLILCVVANLLIYQGRYEESEQPLTEAIGLARQEADLDTETVALVQAGLAAWGRGDHWKAISLLTKARGILHELGDHHNAQRIPARHLAGISLSTGNIARAVDEYRTFLSFATNSVAGMATIVPGIASLAGACGEPETAAKLFGAGSALAEMIGLTPLLPERLVHERAYGEAQSALDAECFSAALRDGRCLSHEELIAEVLTVLERAANWCATIDFSASAPNPVGLTARELDVLRLLSDHHTDQEIADRLFITRRTASKHVASILAKLDVPHRRAAAAEALRLGLVARRHQ